MMTRLWPSGCPIQAEAAGEGAPARFFWQGRWHTVAAVANHWRVRSSWWSPATAAHRDYFKLVTTDGLLCTVYLDLHDGAWYGVRIYD